jgi:hypothetical protein
VSSVFQHFQESYQRTSYNWLELNNQYLYIAHFGFSYYAHDFFENALHVTVNQFIDTGIIQHLFDENYDQKFVAQPDENSPNVLSLQDLGFGFYIWLGTLSVISNRMLSIDGNER